MDAINLIFEVHAYIPNWIHRISDVIKKNAYTDIRYRIFVNDDLIVERNWIWDSSIFLKENLWVTGGLPCYNVRLDPQVHIPTQIKFALKKINEQHNIDFNADNRLELSFKV